VIASNEFLNSLKQVGKAFELAAVEESQLEKKRKKQIEDLNSGNLKSGVSPCSTL
jgi:hypothetical protein